MAFDDWVKEAARRAGRAVDRAIKKYRDELVTDEDDLTGVLLGNLDAELQGKIGGLTWNSSILRHRKGKAAQEKRIGADILIHVVLATQNRSYSKGVLIQAKRCDKDALLTVKAHTELHDQCTKMVSVSPSSFVFDYTRSGVRCGSAVRIAGSANRALYEECTWTSYRFFQELFRCPIGDPAITSARVKDLPVPSVIQLRAKGEEPSLHSARKV